MSRLGAILRRDLWPRRRSILLAGLVSTSYAIWQAKSFISRREPVETGEVVITVIVGWFGVMSLYAVAHDALKRRRVRRHDQRRALGLCGQCGYDLRGAVSPTCPECNAYHGTTPGRARRGTANP